MSLILRVKHNLKILLGALLDSHDEQENFDFGDESQKKLSDRWPVVAVIILQIQKG
jgi:hypothetical protein